jgi:hypothetical protein
VVIWGSHRETRNTVLVLHTPPTRPPELGGARTGGIFQLPSWVIPWVVGDTVRGGQPAVLTHTPMSLQDYDTPHPNWLQGCDTSTG